MGKYEGYTCPKCEKLGISNKGCYSAKYYHNYKYGYIYHTVVDNDGKWQSHSIGARAPPWEKKTNGDPTRPLHEEEATNQN